jgi:hypothetical protein
VAAASEGPVRRVGPAFVYRLPEEPDGAITTASDTSAEALPKISDVQLEPILATSVDRQVQ